MNLKQSLLFTLELNQKTNIKHSVSHQSLLICKSLKVFQFFCTMEHSGIHLNSPFPLARPFVHTMTVTVMK